MRPDANTPAAEENAINLQPVKSKPPKN